MAAPKVSKLCQECQHGDLEAHAKDANNFAFEEVHDGAEWDAQMKAFVEGVPTPTKKRNLDIDKETPPPPLRAQQAPKLNRAQRAAVFDTWDDVADWPAVNAKLMFCPGPASGPGPMIEDAGRLRKMRMTRLTEYATVAPQSDFSGRVCAETSWRMQSLALGTAGISITLTAAHSECDPAPHPMERWRTAVRHKPDHYFKNIVEQLSNRHKAEFYARLPDYEKDDGETILKAHDSIKNYFLKKRHIIWPKHRKAFCEEHQKMCPVFSHRCCRDSSQSASFVEHWQVPVVGSDCTPWTSQGGRSGWKHEAIPRFWVALSKLLSGNYVMFCLENSGNGFPIDEIRSIIREHGFGSLAAIVCPTQSGFPAVRHRALLTCYDDAKFVSVIPSGLKYQQEAWEDAFLADWSPTIQLDENAFVGDSLDHNLAEIQGRARKRGIFNCKSDLPLAEQMAPGLMRSRFQNYLAKVGDGDGSSIFVDLSQGGDETHFVMQSGKMPPLTKSSQILSLSTHGASGERGHFLTARELDFSQGWPVYAPQYHQCLQHDPDTWYDSCSQNGQLFLRGNGQHLQAMGAWMCWTFSNLLLLSDVQQFDPVHMCYPVESPKPFTGEDAEAVNGNQHLHGDDDVDSDFSDVVHFDGALNCVEGANKGVDVVDGKDVCELADVVHVDGALNDVEGANKDVDVVDGKDSFDFLWHSSPEAEPKHEESPIQSSKRNWTLDCDGVDCDSGATVE